ncbi:MAG: hypothetical protein HC773_13450 [Scytonema sp. CRU_2_7]|nr:hypothetical protein [Scytonema sp. CRU_2_7]
MGFGDNSKKELLTKNEPKSGITTIIVTPNGKQVISGSDNGIITIWDLITRNKLKTFPHSNDRSYLQDLVVTPDGQRFISASTNGTIKVWDLTTGKI